MLDMDGVLADFNAGIHLAHGKPIPQIGSGPQKWDLEKTWGITLQEFWAPSNNIEFWAGLPMTPEADLIVDTLEAKVGAKNVALLTNPSLFDGCIGAKRQWVKEYYPELAEQMIFTSAKSFLATPDTVLVDDSDKNIANFAAAGGKTLLVPRLWNRDWALTPITASVFLERAACLLQ